MGSPTLRIRARTICLAAVLLPLWAGSAAAIQRLAPGTEVEVRLQAGAAEQYEFALPEHPQQSWACDREVAIIAAASGD
jgi:hypothetical protein